MAEHDDRDNAAEQWDGITWADLLEADRQVEEDEARYDAERAREQAVRDWTRLDV
jgi:hypothetical protein